MEIAYILHIAIITLIFSILGMSLNLLVGLTGLLSVAHAAFYGIGAYTTAILTTRTEWGFFLALPVAMLASMIFALSIALVLSRFRGDYYALGSLAFGIILYSFLLNIESLTRGPRGIPGIPSPEFFGHTITSGIPFFVLTLILSMFVYVIASIIEKSSFGRVLKAIREDEDALAVFGYHTSHFKLTIFTISAGLAAIAGSLYASYIHYIDPTSFTINESIFILAIIIIGGLGSIRGAVLGAVLLILLPEVLRFIGIPDAFGAEVRHALYGLALLIIMLFHPNGLLGKYKI